MGTSPLGVLSGCLEAAFSAAHLIDSPQLQGSSCLGWVMVPEVQVRTVEGIAMTVPLLLISKTFWASYRWI